MLQVAVARVSDPAPGAGLAMPAWLGDSERRRWMTLTPAARAAFAASRSLLRELLQAATGVPADAWDVSAQVGTVPVARVTRAQAAPTAMHVSLSHRRGWVAAAVSDAAVGVDIEVAHPSRSDPDERAALMLAPEELPAWNALAPEARESALLTRWTAKEAWFKAAPSQDAAWDFRRVVARACPPGRANVRTWAAPPLHVAVSCSDPRELAEVECAALDSAACSRTFWHVGQA